MSAVSEKKIFSIDAETIGLLGEPFAVGYTICDMEGKELESGYLSCDPAKAAGLESSRAWVNKNVIPHLPKEYNCSGPDDLCERVYAIWMAAKDKYKDMLAIVDCGFPVETALFTRMLKLNEKERQFTGPFPLHEVGTALDLAGMKYEDFPPLGNELPQHNPVNDARRSARLYLLAKRRIDTALAALKGATLSSSESATQLTKS